MPLWDWLGGSRGSASWGAYAGAAIGLVGYAGLARAPGWTLMDTAASWAGLGPSIGRFACLLAGDDFGRVTVSSLAIRFPQGSVPFKAHVSAGLIGPEAASSLAVHPFQIYLALNGLFVFLIVSAVWRRKSGCAGLTLGTFLGVYGLTRFIWEYLRDPAAGGARGGLSASQVMCTAVAGLGACILVMKINAMRRSVAPLPVT